MKLICNFHFFRHPRCDPGYGGPYCVSQHPLPMDQRDTFDAAPSSILWPEIYGGEISHICGTLVSGTSLAFFKVSLYKCTLKWPADYFIEALFHVRISIHQQLAIPESMIKSIILSR